MIDFHSHILPSLDDGSEDVEETFDLLKEAQEAGFNSIITTSHYMEEYYEADVNEREIWIKALNKNMDRKNLQVKLYLGSEIYASSNIIELIREEKACSINDTRYVLFEYPLNSEPFDMMNVIYDLQEYGFVPVLAHPERYVFFQKRLDRIYDLIEKGVLMQSNYGSVLGVYGKNAEFAIRKMLECNMVHFLGTDVHKRNSIYPKVSQALEEIEKIVGEEKLLQLTTKNPSLVIKNELINKGEPIFPKYSIKEKFFKTT